MKKLLIILLFPIVGFGQLTFNTNSSIGVGDPPNSMPKTLNINGISFSGGESSKVYRIANIVQGKQTKCVPYEKTLNKKVTNEGNFPCLHDWIYAEYKDLNTESNIVLAVYCECGCPRIEHKARICKICLRHEKWDVESGQKPEEYESEYQKLVKKTKL